ncbi:hypothetical protein [Streptomyces sp. NPDC002573]
MKQMQPSDSRRDLAFAAVFAHVDLSDDVEAVDGGSLTWRAGHGR